MLLCSNMDSSKCCLLVVDKSVNPRCFKGGKSLPVKYLGNKKSWLTRAIFKDCITNFDCDMKSQSRKVCLLIDNCLVHNVEDIYLESR